LRRSNLVAKELSVAKEGHILGRTTMSLFYATDFADQLEHVLVPALRAGFIVLADRYIYTAIARAGVRGVDSEWIRQLYGFAIAPHLVFYLKIEVDQLVRRVLQAGGMEYWESGQDLKAGDDIYDNFRNYQRQLLKEYAAMSDEFGFRVIEARKSINAIQDELRRQIGEFLEQSDGPRPLTVDDASDA
jgi:dTMP kinase